MFLNLLNPASHIHDAARKVENSLTEVLSEGKVVTADIGGNASTMEMASEIRRKIEEK